MARPKKDPEERLEVRSVRFTRGEWRLVEQAAKSKGTTPVAWLRETAVRAARRTGVTITVSPIHEGITMTSDRV